MGIPTYTVVVDSREQKPLRFPDFFVCAKTRPTESEVCETLRTVRVETTTATLETGDYCLRGCSHLCLVERKASRDELGGYLFTRSGLARFRSQLSRLREATSSPFLLFEGDLADLGTDPAPPSAAPSPRTPTTRTKPRYSGAAVRDGLMELLAEYSIPLLIFPTHTPLLRRRAAELVLSLLIARSFPKTPTLPTPLE